MLFRVVSKNRIKNSKDFLLSGITMLVILLAEVGRVYAIDYEGTVDEPYPSDFLVPLARIFNLFLAVAGAILVVLIIYAAIKMAMAFGDPRKLMASRSTLQYALFGFFVIVAFFTGIAFIAGALGIPFLSTPNEVFDRFKEGIDDFLEFGRVFTNS